MYGYREKTSKNVFSNYIIMISIFSLIIFTNLFILLCGLYVMHLFTIRSFSFLKNDKIKSSLFWSTFIILCIINFSFIISELVLFINTSKPNQSDLLYLKMNVPMMIIFTLIEICIISIISKDTRVTNPKSFLFRAAYVFALYNMLWFAHRVANCFIVSIYFIAIAPSQTIAVITLCISTIVILVAALTSIVNLCHSSTPCVKTCNTLTIMLIVFNIVLALIFFTIIFVGLTQHGLSASQMGSILLSLTIPMLIIFALQIGIGVIFSGHKEESDGKTSSTTKDNAGRASQDSSNSLNRDSERLPLCENRVSNL